MGTIAYLRVSTDDQAESGLGLAAQREAIIRAFGEVPDDSWFQDAVSGGPKHEDEDPEMAERPELFAALKALRPRDRLVVAKLDRLARGVYLSAWIQKEVRKRGATLASAAGEGTDDDSPTNRLLRAIVVAFAEFERHMIRHRTKAAMGAKRARGEVVGHPAYGFRRDGDMLVPDQREQDVIRSIQRWRGKGKTLGEILGLLAANKMEPRAVQWTRRHVKALRRGAILNEQASAIFIFCSEKSDEEIARVFNARGILLPAKWTRATLSRILRNGHARV